MEFAEHELAMVEHAEALRHRVIARLSHQDAICLPEVRLTDDTSQRREVAEGTRIEQDGQMPGRRIAALPFLGATIVLFPDDGHRQFTGEGWRRGRNNGRITGHRVGFHADDQTACLEVPTKRGKLLLGRIDHDMQVAGNNTNDRLVAGCRLGNAEVVEQVMDVVGGRHASDGNGSHPSGTNRLARNRPCRCPRRRCARSPRDK